jgi:hypothetical protein
LRPLRDRSAEDDTAKYPVADVLPGMTLTSLLIHPRVVAPAIAAAVLVLTGCDARTTNAPPTVEKNETTIINPPAEKKVEHNTTIVNPPAEKKVEKTTTIVNPPAEKAPDR